MALSPSIPTSFVPKQPAPQDTRRFSGNNIFLLVALVIFFVALAASAGVFLFSAYLKTVQNTKGAQLVQAQQAVSPDSVQQFVRLHDRLIAAKTIVTQHVELSQFFDLLEKVTLSTVSFKSLAIQVADDRTATLQLSGVAHNFNALAAESKTFAAQQYIKSAIFQDIAINKDGTVSFSISATLDSKVVVEAAPPATAAALPAATSTQPAAPTLPTVTPAPPSPASTTAGSVATPPASLQPASTTKP